MNSQEDSNEKEQIEVKELEYIENHLDEYPHYDNREDLWKSLLSDD